MRSRAARLARVVVSAGLGAATLVAAATGALSNACSTAADAGRSTDSGRSDVTCTIGGRTFREDESVGVSCSGICWCAAVHVESGDGGGIITVGGLACQAKRCADFCSHDGAVIEEGESVLDRDRCNICTCEARDIRIPYDSVLENLVYGMVCTRDRVCVDASADAALEGDAGSLPDGPSEAGPD